MIVDAQNPYSLDEADTHTISLGDSHQGCFYCGKQLDTPFIEWHGQNEKLSTLEVIQLHPECAVEFTIRLLRDVHQFECEYRKSELLTPAE